MEVKLKTNETVLKIPILSSRDSYSNWREEFYRYAKSLKLEHFLDYNVQEPALELVVKEEMDEDQALLRKLSLESKANIKLEKIQCIPVNIRQAMIHASTVNYFARNEPVPGMPKEFFQFLLEASVAVADSQLFVVYTRTEKYIPAMTEYMAKRSKLETLMLNTVAKNIKNLIKNVEIKAAFELLENKFRKDHSFERKRLRRVLRTIRCPNLTDFITNFELKVAEYETVGGWRTDEAVGDAFYDGINSEKYQHIKVHCDAVGFDTLLDFWRPYAEKEAAESANKLNSSNNTSVIHVKQVKYEGKDPVRCKNCRGIGHDSSICPSKADLCYNCGISDHKQRNCPKKMNTKINIKKALLDLVNSHLSESENDQSEPEESISDHENLPDIVPMKMLRIRSKLKPVKKTGINKKLSCITDLKGHQIHTVQCNKLRILKANAKVKKTSELVLTLDSACTQSATNRKDALRDLKQIHPIDMIDANGIRTSVEWCGTMDVTDIKGQRIVLKQVLFAPKLDGTLIGVNHLLRKGKVVNFRRDQVKNEQRETKVKYYAQVHRNKKIHTFPWCPKEGLYQLEATVTNLSRHVKSTKIQEHPHFKSTMRSRILHGIFGHFSDSVLNRAGLKVNTRDCFCKACANSKAAASPHGKDASASKTKYKPRRRCEMFSLDTYGPFPKSVKDGFQYISVLKDEYCDFLG